MKHFIILLMSLTFFSMSQAQSYPEKPVKIVTNLPVGSAPDTVLRKIANRLKDQWKVPVIVDNRPGAAGAVAMEHYVQNEKNDGYTLYMGDMANFTSMPLLFQKENLLSEIKPLVPVYRNWFAVVTPTNTDVKKLSSAIKNKPFYGSWAVGSPGHLCGAEISDRLNIEATHISYKDYNNWYTDIIGGQLSFSCSSIGSVDQYVKSGRLKLVAVTGPQRDSNMPDVPTVKEVFGFDLGMPHGWIAMFIHKKVDDQLVKKIHNDVAKVINSDEIKEAIQLSYGIPFNVTLNEFQNVWQNDLQNYRKLLNKYKISIK